MEWINRNIEGSGVVLVIMLFLVALGITGAASNAQKIETFAQANGLVKIKVVGYITTEDAKLIYSKVK